MNWNWNQFTDDVRTIVGEPNTGIHTFRLFNIAIIDVVLTIITAIVISYIIKKRIDIVNIFIMLGVLLVLGIVSHRLFNVRTTIDKILFP